MNKQELIELAKTLGEHASPQLRTYIYVEWVGWLTFFIVACAVMALLWRKREKMNAAMDGFPIAYVLLAFGVCFVAMLAIMFVPYTLHVLMTPELEAIKSLLGK